MYWAGYFEGTKNTNTCPENSIPIKTEQECRDASSALGVSFKASGEFSSSAKGCSLVHTSDVYWNTHSTGSPNVREGPICKGNYPLWFLKGVYVYFWIKPTVGERAVTKMPLSISVHPKKNQKRIEVLIKC